MTTIAGGGGLGLGCGTFADGSASSARFRNPRCMALDASRGVLYIADGANNRIRSLRLTGANELFFRLSFGIFVLFSLQERKRHQLSSSNAWKQPQPFCRPAAHLPRYPLDLCSDVTVVFYAVCFVTSNS